MPDTYVLCTTPRSGSTLLCDLLRQTGVAGWPESFFRQLSVPFFARDFGLPPQDGEKYDESYITEALKVARNGGSLAGIRLMWNGIDTLERIVRQYHPDNGPGAETIAAAFGETRYIYLERGDRLAQAISRARAEQSGLWHRNADGSVREQTGPARQAGYDRDMIQHYLDEQASDIAAWNAWFQAFGISPHRLTYEALTSDPSATVAGILTFLGLDPNAATALAPATAKLADETSERWANRFRAQAV